MPLQSSTNQGVEEWMVLNSSNNKQVSIEAYKERQMVYLWELNHEKELHEKEIRYQEVR